MTEQMPCVIGREAVKRIVEMPLDDAERKGLLASADLLRQTLTSLKDGAAHSVAN